MRRTAIALALALLALPAPADEGMWMPQQIPDLAPRLRAMGFAGDPNAFADLTGFPMGAIVSLGGCSASFVSPEGLVVTNHHCVQGALQYNSKLDRNLMVDGFLAKTRSEELWVGPSSRVLVTVSVKDVTEEITGKIDPKTTDRQRYDLVEKRVKARTAACEKDGLRCTVSSFFEGKKWFELAQMEIRDVRLVYAPAAGIGNFGGETDNWQWPRHTGDFSFYRAYVSPAGKAVPFAKENVPYRPKQFLKVSTKGANPGELVFVAGYPGRTYRLNTYAEVKETVDFTPAPRREAVRGADRPPREAVERGQGDGPPRLHSPPGPPQHADERQGSPRRDGQGGAPRPEGGEREGPRRLDRRRPGPEGRLRRRPPGGLNALVVEKARTRERDALLLELAGGMGPVPNAALGSAQALYPLLDREAEAGRATATRPTSSGTGSGSARRRNGRSGTSTRRPTAS